MKNTKVASMEVVFEQPSDANCSSAAPNKIQVETHDGDDGAYFTIVTDRWAFGSIDELSELLHSFRKVFNGEDNVFVGKGGSWLAP